jgi:hypothetical protein
MMGQTKPESPLNLGNWKVRSILDRTQVVKGTVYGKPCIARPPSPLLFILRKPFLRSEALGGRSLSGVPAHPVGA